MADAFIDESWLTSTATGDYFLAVVAVITSRRRRLELLVRRAKRTPKLKAKSEIKASVTPPSLVKKMLRALAGDPELSIVAAIWRGKQKDVIKPEQLYQSVVGRCALHAVRRNPRIDLWLDKRYTDDFQKRELEGAVREAIAVVPGNIVRVFQEESHVVKELAAPDFVAWAFMQYYGRGNDEFYRLVRSRVAHFEDLSGKKKSGSP